jgi:dTDP-4-dehydrorhamnose 3,5-epimerase-like enzyme
MAYKIFKNFTYNDFRGGIEKNLYLEIEKKLNFKVKESCFSYSKKGTLRGLYIQTGIMMERKIITLIYGTVYWFILDIKNKKKQKLIKLKKHHSLYVPKGFAHGCYASEDSLLHIMSDKVFNNKFSKNFSWFDKNLNIKYLKRFKNVLYKDKINNEI